MSLRFGSRRADRGVSGVLLFVGVAVAYYALAATSWWLDDPGRAGAAFRPATGLAVGLLLWVPRRRWGWVLAAVAVAECSADLVEGYRITSTLWWTVGACVGPLVGVVMLGRWGNMTGSLVPLRQFGRFFVAAVVVGPAVGASIGSLGAAVAGGPVGDFNTWPRPVLSSALGVLVVAPALLCWRQPRIARRGAETALLTLTILAMTLVAFGTWAPLRDAAWPYLVIPPLLWAALRYGVRGAAIAVLAVAQIAGWSTAAGSGPFARAAADNGQAILLLQMFTVITAVTTFVLAALVEDLVDHVVVEAGLERQAATDALTGLPNRSVLARDLHGRAASASRGGVGVCVCDLDDFKVVNDGLGHHAGDEVLVEVARRMRQRVRSEDVVARFGGDEFVIVMSGSVGELEALARRVIAHVAEPMTLADGTRLSQSVSAGIAYCEPGGDPDPLLRDADVALFRAKELGRGRLYRFDDALRVRVMDRLFIQTELPDAFAEDQLSCVYQPEIVIATGQLFGFEALSRWEHPTRGPISPDQFIPVIEAIGAADRLFEKILDEALAAQSQWAAHLGFHPSIAVNVSPRQLGDTDLAATVARILDRHSGPVDKLWIEVTESAIAEDDATTILHELHELGVRIAIDDFGTGWSSMTRLTAFPWDLLKIDRSFVSALGAAHDSADQVVTSTIAIAHSLGSLTTAEGVETTQQLERLGEMGCDLAQGFLFARPAAAGDAITHVAPDGSWTGPGVLGVARTAATAGPETA